MTVIRPLAPSAVSRFATPLSLVWQSWLNLIRYIPLLGQRFSVGPCVYTNPFAVPRQIEFSFVELAVYVALAYIGANTLSYLEEVRSSENDHALVIALIELIGAKQEFVLRYLAIIQQVTRLCFDWSLGLSVRHRDFNSSYPMASRFCLATLLTLV